MKKVYKWIEDNRREIINFCCDGISQKSVTGAELPFQEWFRNKCEEAALGRVDFWAEDKDKLRPNVVCTVKGKGNAPSLILNGHCDVVPVSPEDLKLWESDPWQGQLRNGAIYGRGATDMKGGLTAMYFAALALKENNIPLMGDLILESVVGEERCEHILGTTATVKRGHRGDFAIVLEPTDCELHTKSPGAVAWELNVKGKTVHNAQANKIKYPQAFGIKTGSDIGVDAFKKALKILDALEDLETQWNFRWRDRVLGGGGYPGKDKSGVGLFCIVPAIIRSGDYIVAVPGHAQVQGCFSYAPWVPFSEAEAEVRDVIDSVVQRDDWLKANPPEFKIFYDWPGYITEPEHPACRALAGAYEEITQKPALFSGFSAVNDASFLYKQGIPAIAFGPGSIDQNAHGNNEYILVEQLILSIKILTNAIVRWCGRAQA